MRIGNVTLFSPSCLTSTLSTTFTALLSQETPESKTKRLNLMFKSVARMAGEAGFESRFGCIIRLDFMMT